MSESPGFESQWQKFFSFRWAFEQFSFEYHFLSLNNLKYNLQVYQLNRTKSFEVIYLLPFCFLRSEGLFGPIAIRTHDLCFGLFTVVLPLMHKQSVNHLKEIFLPKAENTNIFYKWKYHCTADLLFDQLGFDQTSKSVILST